jgi:integrase
MAALSDRKLRGLKARSKPYELADGGGLYAHVLPSGHISLRYQYRLAGRKQRVVLGTYPALTLAHARQLHRKFQTMVEQGISPARYVQEEKTRERGVPADLFQTLAESWLAQWGSNKNEATVGHVRGWLTKDVYPRIGDKSVKSITPAHVLDVLDKIKGRGAPHSARRIHGTLTQIFDHAVNRLIIETNPVDRISASSIAPVSSRDRALTKAEIGIFLRAMEASTCRQQSKIALRLVLLTMVRKQELLQARWENVDLEQRVWSVLITKNKKPLEVYLSRQVVALFNRLKELAGGSPFVLPHVSRIDAPMGSSTLNEAIRRITEQENIHLARFSVHDLRRTASTQLHEMGFSPDIIEKALNHVIGGVRGVYNKATYADQRRLMLQQWADIVDVWMAQETNVVALRGSQHTEIQCSQACALPR